MRGSNSNGYIRHSMRDATLDWRSPTPPDDLRALCKGSQVRLEVHMYRLDIEAIRYSVQQTAYAVPPIDDHRIPLKMSRIFENLPALASLQLPQDIELSLHLHQTG